VVPPLLEEVEAELQYLDEMILHVQLADEERSLNALRRELETAGYLKALHPKRKPSKQHGAKPAAGPYRRLVTHGTEILIGLSAEGNATVTFKMAEPDDLWFHARGAPGAHVILRERGGTSSAALEMAARLAAGYSAVRSETRVEVDYTVRKHVRKISGAAPGRVTYTGETTLRVEPVAPGEFPAPPSSSEVL
jgi:predicted ribosome quality control (RQC) complex YloA/Tae2 family protein